MIKDLTKKDVLVGYFAQGLNIASGVILIPIVVKFLSVDDLGLWYLFLAIISLAQLMEFGFQPTITRFSTYVYSGATRLQSDGIPEIGEKINGYLIAELKKASENVYRIVTFLITLLLFIGGTLYLNTFKEFGQYQMYAWMVFVIANIINFYFSYYNGLLIGRGDQTEFNMIIAKSKVILLAVTSILLFKNFGLMALSIGQLVSTIYTRYSLSVSYKKHDHSYDIGKASQNYTYTLWKASYKLGLTSLGGFLILRSSTFIVSTYFGIEAASAYGLTLQLITILMTVSSIFFTLNFPKFSFLQSKGNKLELRSRVAKAIFVSLFLYLLGSLVIVLFGKEVLNIISSKGVSILGNNILIPMLIVYFLELNHSLCAKYITTTNTVPFLNATIISGIAIVTLNLVFASFFNYGLLGVILIQGGVQFVYNNWYWPYYVVKDLYFGKKI